MNTPIHFLDALLLLAASGPSGFSHSLFTLSKRSASGDPTAKTATTTFLAFLLLPFAVVGLAARALRPELAAFRFPSAALLGIAALLAPAGLLLDYTVPALLVYRRTRKLLMPITLHSFWGRGPSPLDHAILALVVLGEEVFYRGIWLGILLHGFGLPVTAAVAISSLAYGLNHTAFGPTAVVSKSAVGMLYGFLYLAGGQSLWLPFVTHWLQNTLLLAVTGSREKRICVNC